MTRTVSISGPHDDDAAWAIIEDGVRALVAQVRREHPTASFTANLYVSGRDPASVDLVAVTDADAQPAVAAASTDEEE